MVSFVQEAVAYAKANGKAKALAEFSDRNGSFFRGELYIYAYDINGTTIGHPVNPEKIGVNRLYEKDAEGNLFITELRNAATNGTGFVTYYYINPTHNNTIEKKLGYAMTVDPSWWLGSGIYQGPADNPGGAATSVPPVGTILTAGPGK
jgi:signal transduction histidine kinase